MGTAESSQIQGQTFALFNTPPTATLLTCWVPITRNATSSSKTHIFFRAKFHPHRKTKVSQPSPSMASLLRSACRSFFFFWGLILSLGWCECWKDGLSILANIPCSLKWVFLIFCVLSLVYGFRFFGYCFDWIQGNCWLFPVSLWTQKLSGSWFCDFLWVDLYLGVYVRMWRFMY